MENTKEVPTNIQNAPKASSHQAHICIQKDIFLELNDLIALADVIFKQ